MDFKPGGKTDEVMDGESEDGVSDEGMCAR